MPPVTVKPEAFAVRLKPLNDAAVAVPVTAKLPEVVKLPALTALVTVRLLVAVRLEKVGLLLVLIS